MKTNDDILKTLIQQLPEEPLPENFNDRLMKKLSDEKIQRTKRNERITIVAITIVSMVMIAMAAFIFKYLDIELEYPNFEMVPFYAFIGTLALLLLIMDYKLRRIFMKEHSSNEFADN